LLGEILRSFFVLSVLACAIGRVGAQELPARQSFGVTGTFAPDSSHIFIGHAEQRRTWTAGFEYGRTLWASGSARLDYEGSFSPFFQERDPTIIGAYEIVDGSVVPVPTETGSVVAPGNGPIGFAFGGGSQNPIYGIYSSEKSYAVAVSPIGARVNGFNSHRLQPTFSLDLGVVFSSRDLPVINSSRFNYLFSFGPGLEYFYRRNDAVRLEYLYRHMSNAGSGDANPGVDQGVFRLTLSHRRR